MVYICLLKSHAISQLVSDVLHNYTFGFSSTKKPPIPHQTKRYAEDQLSRHSNKSFQFSFVTQINFAAMNMKRNQPTSLLVLSDLYNKDR